MVKRLSDGVYSQLKEYIDSAREITNIKITEEPWTLWRDLEKYDRYFRSTLCDSLYYTLLVRLFRSYINQEISKNRSRKGAAVKRAYTHSKKDAQEIIDTLEVLDLDQLWEALDTRSSFDSKSLNDRLEAILSKDINSILKIDITNTEELRESADNYSETDSEYGSEDDSEFDSDDSNISQINRLKDRHEDVEKSQSGEKGDLRSDDGNLKAIEDKFFKFDDMEAFANEQFDPGDDIDYFDSLGEESDDSVPASKMKYSDFFKDPDASDEELVEDLKPLSCNKNLKELDKYDKQMELMLQQLEDQEEGMDEDEDMYRDELELLDEADEEENSTDENEMNIEKVGDSNDKELKDKNSNLDGEEDKIAQIERELVAPKHWSLMGESTAKNRPRNSLLDLELELPQSGSIVYSSETNKGSVEANGTVTGHTNVTNGEQLPLELLIIQRIKSGVFDNVERKTFVEDQLESLNRLNKNKNEEIRPEDMDFKKSEMGLGEVYAQKYKEQFMAIDKLDPHKKDLNEQFARLIYKLDSLSNTTFVPKRTSVTEKLTSVPMISVETPVNIVLSGSNKEIGEANGNKKLLGKNLLGDNRIIDPDNPLSSTNKRTTMPEKVSRSAKKRKFKNKMKQLVNSGILTADQVKKIKEKMINRNKLRREESQSKKKTGLTSREAIKHDMKSNRRIDTNELLSSIGK